MDMDKMNLKFQLFNKRLLQITNEIQRLRLLYLKQFGLTGIHFVCIVALDGKGELTAKELMEEDVVDKAQVSRALNDLIDKCYVQAVPGQTGVYKKKYALTDKGREMAGKVKQIAADIVLKADEGISEEDIAVMYSTLDRIYSNLYEVGR